VRNVLKTLLPKGHFSNTKIAIGLFSTLLLFSIALWFFFIPLETDIVGIPLVDSKLAISIPIKIIIGVWLLAIPFLFFLINRSRTLYRFPKYAVLSNFEPIVITLFLAQFIFQAKFTLNSKLAITYVIALAIFFVLFLLFLYLVKFVKPVALGILVKIYSLLGLACVYYINFLAYNFFILKSALIIISSLILILLLFFRTFSERSIDIFYRIPFWLLLLFPERIGLIGIHPFESFGFSNFQLLKKGFLPWRDFSLEHGIWEDLGRNWLGALVGGPSFWGQASGISGFVQVLEWLIIAYIIYFVCKRAYLSIMTVLVLEYFSTHVLDIAFPRMIPIIALTVILRIYILNQTNLILGVMGVTMATAMLWSYESIFGVLTTFIVLYLHSIKKRIDFKKILLVLLPSFLLSLVIPLKVFNLLDSWVKSAFFDHSGYVLAWSAELYLNYGPLFYLILIFVPTSIMILAFYVYRDLLNRVADSETFIWITPTLISVTWYFVKFLAWPDWHLSQSFSVLILLLVLIFLARKQMLRNIANSKILVIILIFSFFDYIAISPSNASSVRYSQANFDESTVNYIKRVTEVQDSFLPFLPKGKNSAIFDFGNEPVTWYGILNFSLSGADSKVLTRMSPSSQLRVIRQLKFNPPDGVVWGGEFGYFNWPPPGNALRHYLISSYILKNFYPVISNGGYTLLLPGTGDNNPNAIIALSNETDCDWGDGNSRFIQPPSDLTTLQVQDIRSNTSFLLNPQSRSLLIESMIDGKFTLASSDGFGEINFTLLSGTNKLWLENCPAWYFGKSSSWKLLGDDGSFRISAKG
jgi:hypothetical protein